MRLIDLVINRILSTRRALIGHDNQRRDINAECQYPDTIMPWDHQEMYNRQGIGARLVELMPQESWKEDPLILTSEEAEETPWEKAWKDFEKEHNLFHWFERIDILSGIGRYGLLLFGLDDGQEDLSQPVEGFVLDGPTAGLGETPRPLELLYIRSFPHSLVKVASYDNNKASRRYGLPNTYRIKFHSPVEGGEEEGAAPQHTEEVTVHWTRVMHIADNTKSSEVFGQPRMQKHYNRLVDLNKVLGGDAETYWQNAKRLLALETNPDIGDATIDVEALRQQLEALREGLQGELLLEGMSANNIAPQVVDPESHFMTQMRAISVGEGIPMRILLGAEAGHLASDQDQGTWNGRVQRRQEKYLSPRLIVPILERLMQYGMLETVETSEIIVRWPDLDTPSEMDKAEVAAKLTDAIAKYIQSGAEEFLPPKEYLVHVWGVEPDLADSIIEAAEAHVTEMEKEEEAQRKELEAEGFLGREAPLDPRQLPAEPAPANNN